MRVLCLHGSGSNGKIMESQISALRGSLPQSWEFDFIDAPHECSSAPELMSLQPGQCYHFFGEFTVSAMCFAVDFVREVVDEDGPYDCILGFSQGASVAAAYLTTIQQQFTPFELRATMAVFICAALIPPTLATGAELAKTIGSLGHLDLPSLHVIGRWDPCLPQSTELAKSCTGRTAQVIAHNGGHDLPRDHATTKSVASAFEILARTAFAG